MKFFVNIYCTKGLYSFLRDTVFYKVHKCEKGSKQDKKTLLVKVRISKTN
jgi:hypothetical protein